MEWAFFGSREAALFSPKILGLNTGIFGQFGINFQTACAVFMCYC